MSVWEPEDAPEKERTNHDLWMQEFAFWLCYFIFLLVAWVIVSVVVIPL